MSRAQVLELCKKVQTIACELDRLTAGGHSRTVYSVMTRMKLAALVSELMTADLLERLKRATCKEHTELPVTRTQSFRP